MTVGLHYIARPYLEGSTTVASLHFEGSTTVASPYFESTTTVAQQYFEGTSTVAKTVSLHRGKTSRDIYHTLFNMRLLRLLLLSTETHLSTLRVHRNCSRVCERQRELQHCTTGS